MTICWDHCLFYFHSCWGMLELLATYIALVNFMKIRDWEDSASTFPRTVEHASEGPELKASLISREIRFWIWIYYFLTLCNIILIKTQSGKKKILHNREYLDHTKQLKDYYPEYIFKSSWPLEKDREANRKTVDVTTRVSQ